MNGIPTEPRRRTRKHSSSVSSTEPPLTPIDPMYSALQSGRLGDTFSVLKMGAPNHEGLVNEEAGHLPEVRSG